MIYTYARQIPTLSNLIEQQQDTLSFAIARGLKIDKEVVEYATKHLPIDEREEFESFLQSMQIGDSVIISSLSIFSDRATELIKVINCMLSRGIDVWIANSSILLNRDTNMVEIFPLLNELSELEKIKSTNIGRPKGSRSNSKFDKYKSEIIRLLGDNSSVSAIAREINISRSSLKDYIESRGLRELLSGTGIENSQVDSVRGLDNVLLICPFEEEKKNRLKVS